MDHGSNRAKRRVLIMYKRILHEPTIHPKNNSEYDYKHSDGLLPSDYCWSPFNQYVFN